MYAVYAAFRIGKHVYLIKLMRVYTVKWCTWEIKECRFLSLGPTRFIQLKSAQQQDFFHLFFAVPLTFFFSSLIVSIVYERTRRTAKLFLMFDVSQPIIWSGNYPAENWDKRSNWIRRSSGNSRGYKNL